MSTCSNVCDGVVHCPYNADDEILCDFEVCPYGCSCIGPMYRCTNLSLTSINSIPSGVKVLLLNNNLLKINLLTFQNYSALLILNLAFNDLKSLPRGSPMSSCFQTQRFLMTLILSYNDIGTITSYMFVGLESVSLLNLEGNNITMVEDFGFYGLLSLVALNLSSQGVSQIQSGAFVGLAALKEIDLSGNDLAVLMDQTFTTLTHLEYVKINHNPLERLSLSLFNSKIQLRMLTVDRAKWCCLASVAHCKTNDRYPKSCNGILESNFHRLHIFALATYCILINTRGYSEKGKEDGSFE